MDDNLLFSPTLVATERHWLITLLNNSSNVDKCSSNVRCMGSNPSLTNVYVIWCWTLSSIMKVMIPFSSEAALSIMISEITC